jgi:hypothetical protein
LLHTTDMGFNWAGGLWKRGGDNDEETQVVARVYVWDGIGVGEACGVRTKLI